MEERLPAMEVSCSLELTTLHHKNKLVMKNLTEPRTWTDSLDKQPKLRNMDMRFGTWNGVVWIGLVWLRIGTGGELL
jgi:hypothetical protein